MSKIRTYARNLAANWIGYVANMLLTVVTSWFVFHLLGDVRYGIWSLMISLTGYLGIVDLGLRPAQWRYFNWYLGRREPEKVNAVVCTNLAFFTGASVILLIAGAALGALFEHIFPKTPPEYLDEVRIALVFTALNVGLSAIASIFGSLIQARERYDLSNVLDFGVAVVRSAGSVLALYLGFGLVGMALAGVVATAVACAGGYVLAHRVFRELAVRYAHVSREMFGELVHFGIPCLLSCFGIRIIAYTSPLLIAWLIGMSAVGYYSLALMLLDYGNMLIQKGATIFIPEIQQSLAREGTAGVRGLVPRVTRATMTISVLVYIGIMAFGQDFLTLLYGTAPGQASGPILNILFVSYLAAAASFQCASVLIGGNRVRLVAAIVLAEASLNIGLTLLLVAVAGWGLPGVALGTAIPMALMSGVAMTVVGARYIGMTPAAFARQTAAYWVPAAAVFGLVCLGLQRGLAFSSWGWFAAKVAAACTLYVPIAWFLLVPRDQKDRLRGWLGSVWQHRRGGAVGSAAPAITPPRAPC